MNARLQARGADLRPGDTFVTRAGTFKVARTTFLSDRLSGAYWVVDVNGAQSVVLFESDTVTLLA